MRTHHLHQVVLDGLEACCDVLVDAITEVLVLDDDLNVAAARFPKLYGPLATGVLDELAELISASWGVTGEFGVEVVQEIVKVLLLIDLVVDDA